MSIQRSAVLLILAAATMSPQAFAARMEPQVIEALLTYPTAGTVDVPATTLIFAEEVTAITLEGPNGEELPTTSDSSRMYYGSPAFSALDDLSPGLWTVKGLPTPEAVNWAGEGVTIDLGTFTVASGTVAAPTNLRITSARWSIMTGSDDFISVEAAADGLGLPLLQPVFLEADLSDADGPLDLQPDFSTPWTRTLGLGDMIDSLAAGIDPETATVRVRLTDAAGNVSDWSAPASFDVETVTQSNRGCSAAPGTSGTAAAPAMLLALGLVLAATRRRRGAPR